MATTVDYGTDISVTFDMDPSGRVVSGRRVVAEAIARRLMTPNGGLIGDPHYGFDVAQYLNDDLGPLEMAELRSGIENECVKDERVLSANVTVESFALDSSRSQRRLEITISLTTGKETFALVLDVSDVGVDLLSVE